MQSGSAASAAVSPRDAVRGREFVKVPGDRYNVSHNRRNPQAVHLQTLWANFLAGTGKGGEA